MAVDPILDYFDSNYGGISSVSLHKQETYISALIQFVDSRKAHRASLSTKHVIAGNQVYVNTTTAKQRTVEFVVESASDLQYYIRNLGSSIQSLSLKADESLIPETHSRILKVLVHYCGSTLVNLKMHGFAFSPNDRTIQMSRSLFPRLRKMVLDDCYISAKWFTKCHELVEVELNETEVVFDGVENLACPKLLKINIGYQREGLLDFFQQNPQLKSVRIFSPGLPGLTNLNALEELRLIAIRSRFDLVPVCTSNIDTLEHLEFVEAIDLELSRRDVDAISRLRKLKTLIINVKICESINFMHMIRDLNKLEDLRVGVQRNPIHARNLLTIIRHKHNLQFLYLSFRYNRNGSNHKNRLQINSETYRKMLDGVLLRENDKPLQIVIVGPRNEITRIDTTFPANPSLRIKCMSFDAVARIFNCNDDLDRLDYFGIADKGFKILISQ